MNKQDTLKEIKKDLAQLFKSRCFVCRKKFGKGFLFHHKKYFEDSAFYGNFKTPLEYHIALRTEILKRKSNFLLLCKNHHHFIEWAKKFGNNTWKRVCQARSMSK